MVSGTLDGQLTLDLGDNPIVRVRSTLFFAVTPDAAAIDQIGQLSEELRLQHGLTGRPPQRERLHVSLQLLGSYDESLARLAAEAAASVTAPPFDITFDTAMSFKAPDPRPLVLCGAGAGVAALKALHRELAEASARVGLGRFRPLSAPHVTLRYDRAGIAKTAVRPVTWTVREFRLVRSFLGQGRHVHVGRWPLAGEPQRS